MNRVLTDESGMYMYKLHVYIIYIYICITNHRVEHIRYISSYFIHMEWFGQICAYKLNQRDFKRTFG